MRTLIGWDDEPVALPLEPSAEWSDDCQGKKDYDGSFIDISTRYWPGPGGGGSMTFNTATGEIGTMPYSDQPSAKAALLVRHAEDDYAELCSAEFKAPTEAEVRAKVEAWVKEKTNKIVAILLEHDL